MKRHGVTLIELLIALAITMIMMGAIVTLFANMTNTVTESRAVIEMTERIRQARNLLQSDLAGHTATTIPPLDPGKDLGFLELIEGLTYYDSGNLQTVGASTKRHLYAAASQNTILGDIDDIVHLTVRSSGKPFVGRMGVDGFNNPIMMESQAAEIIWFMLPNGRILTTANGTQIQLCTLYRRVLLVLPGYSLQGAGAVPALYANYDISAHNDPVTGQTVANTLGDLTKRENRFYHGVPGNNPPTNFPYQLNPANLNPATYTPAAILTGKRLGEDVILDNVLAFDMRVYDPLAAFVKGADGTMLGPSDPGYTLGGVASLQSLANAGGMLGGFVDMGYTQYSTTPNFIFWGMNSYFSSGQGGSTYSQLLSTFYNTYDTWSLSYEQDGIDQDKSGVADQGMNGFDDVAGPGPYPANWLSINGIVDDPPGFTVDYALGLKVVPFPGERETQAPYPYPLRAVQVTLRVYENDSRQVRQVTVNQDFVPE